MDLKQIEYIVAIEKYGNITKAAEHLYITPSALNQQLSKVETELDQKLFVRAGHRMEPTLAGQTYLKAAKEIIDIKKQTYSALSDISNSYQGEYRLGVAFEHGADALVDVYPEFNKLYPKVLLRCRAGMVNWQIEQLRQGNLDMALVLLTEKPETDDHYIPLSEENLLLGMPVSHPLAHLSKSPDGRMSVIDLSLLKDTPFALMTRMSTMRAKIDPLFQQAGYRPTVIFESSQNRKLQELSASQMCCTIIPQTYATNHKDLVWFALPSYPRFTFYALYRKNTVLNRSMQDLIRMVRDYSQKHFNFPYP